MDKDDTQDKTLIFQLLPLITKEIGAIEKTRKAQIGTARYNFRGIDDVYNALNPLLGKHKICSVPEVLSCERTSTTNSNGKQVVHAQIMLKMTYYAQDGSSVSAVIPAEGLDYSDKAINKAISAAVKYAHFVTFSIPTEASADSEQDDIPAGLDQNGHPVWGTKTKGGKRVSPVKSNAIDDSEYPGAMTDDELAETAERLHDEIAKAKNQTALDIIRAHCEKLPKGPARISLSRAWALQARSLKEMAGVK